MVPSPPIQLPPGSAALCPASPRVPRTHGDEPCRNPCRNLACADAGRRQTYPKPPHAGGRARPVQVVDEASVDRKPLVEPYLNLTTRGGPGSTVRRAGKGRTRTRTRHARRNARLGCRVRGTRRRRCAASATQGRRACGRGVESCGRARGWASASTPVVAPLGNLGAWRSLRTPLRATARTTMHAPRSSDALLLCSIRAAPHEAVSLVSV